MTPEDNHSRLHYFTIEYPHKDIKVLHARDYISFDCVPEHSAVVGELRASRV